MDMNRSIDIDKARETVKLKLQKNKEEKRSKLNRLKEKVRFIIPLFLKKGIFFSFSEICECGSIDTIIIEENEYCLKCMKEVNENN